MQPAVKAAREVELLVVGERLIAEHEDRVPVHAGPDLGEDRGVEDLAQRDRTRLRDETRVQRSEFECHVRQADGRVPASAAAVSSLSRVLCRPSASKFSGASQCA